MILHNFIYQPNKDFVSIHPGVNFMRIYMSTFICTRCGISRTAPKSASFQSENNLGLPDDNCDLELVKRVIES